MSVYKKVCSETGRVYYGSTKNDLSIRLNKGHKNCTCQDFVNPETTIIESISDDKLRYERELYYIRNFECVNKSGKGITFTPKEYYQQNKERIKEQQKKSQEKCKVWEKFPCPLCGKLTNKKHIKRHQRSNYCKNNRDDKEK